MKFVQAAHYRPGPRGVPIQLLVIHDMEYPETKPTAAEDCAHFFATTSNDVSAHYCVDIDSEVQCVRDSDIAYHCRKANRNGIGFEMAGYAAQTRHDWIDSRSVAIMRRTAALVAEKCHQYKIPVRWAKFASSTDPRVVQTGITCHRDVPLHGTHTDPGSSFPRDVFLRMVQEAYAPNAPAPKPTTPPPWFKRNLSVGVRGDDVKIVQRKLGLAVDGIFGPNTEAKVKGFQMVHKLTADGVVGPKTAIELGP